MSSIAVLLGERFASVKLGRSGSPDIANQRSSLTKTLVNNYVAYQPIRQHLVLSDSEANYAPSGPLQQALLNKLVNNGVLAMRDHNVFRPSDAHADRYCRGEWLEEFMYLVALEAGSDETVFAQQFVWDDGETRTKSEIDVIARKDDRLVFVSCKTARPFLEDVSRAKLTSYLHDADNLVDLFGGAQDQVVLAVTTDLIDESRDDAPRYASLFAKARRLGVHLLPLDNMNWGVAVDWFRQRLDGSDANAPASTNYFGP